MSHSLVPSNHNQGLALVVIMTPKFLPPHWNWRWCFSSSVANWYYQGGFREWHLVFSFFWSWFLPPGFPLSVSPSVLLRQQPPFHHLFHIHHSLFHDIHVLWWSYHEHFPPLLFHCLLLNIQNSFKKTCKIFVIKNEYIKENFLKNECIPVVFSSPLNTSPSSHVMKLSSPDVWSSSVA